MPEANHSINFEQVCEYVDQLQRSAETSRHLAGLLEGLRTLAANELWDPWPNEMWAGAVNLCMALEPEDSKFFGENVDRPNLHQSAADAAALLERFSLGSEWATCAMNIYKALAQENKNIGGDEFECISLRDAAAEAVHFLFKNAP